jgi:S1-C subfamily serine protease
MGVAKDSPADKGGLQAGDSIILLEQYKIGNLEDIDGALRKFKAGDKVKVTVLRDGKSVVLEVTLGEAR